MSTDPDSRPVQPRPGAPLLLRLLVVIGFAVSALVHLSLAGSPWVAGGELTLSALFVADAATLLLVGAWILVRPSPVAWAIAVVAGLSSLLPLLVSTYVRVPGPGPLPALYEPVWYAEKAVAAVAAGVAATGSAVALVLARRRRGSS